MPGTAAAAAGFRPGDQILARRRARTRRPSPTSATLSRCRPSHGRPGPLRARRQIASSAVTPRARRGRTTFGQNSSARPARRRRDRRAASEVSSLRPFRRRSMDRRVDPSIVDGLGQIISGAAARPRSWAARSRSPQIAGQQAQPRLVAFFSLLAIVSINLGFINLLPVPMLDGGHLLFYAVEGVRRRPLSAGGAGMGVPRRAGANAGADGLRDVQRSGLVRPLGRLRRLIGWRVRAGQEQGLGGERAAAPFHKRRGRVISSTKSFKGALARCSWSGRSSAASPRRCSPRPRRRPPPAARHAAPARRRSSRRRAQADDPLDHGRRQPAARAGDDPRLRQAAPGQTYTAETLDQALKDLYATELFADVTITGAETGDLVIRSRENPVINRIILEGNKRLKDDKITPEIRLAPRQIFTRSRGPRRRRPDHRAVPPPGPLRREGRAQDRPARPESRRCRVRDLRGRQVQGPRDQHHRQRRISATAACARKCTPSKPAALLGFLKSNDTYDPDRLAADQQKLRAFYLTQGYADFRVVSALAELTPDRRDFVITYVVEEGPRYKFGTVKADSALARSSPTAQVKLIAESRPAIGSTPSRSRIRLPASTRPPA